MIKHLEDLLLLEIKPFRKSWKLVCKHKYPLTPFNFKASNYVKMIGWEKAPFTRIIPLMILPDVFDTNTMWTYLIEQELVIRKDINVNQKMLK